MASHFYDPPSPRRREPLCNEYPNTLLDHHGTQRRGPPRKRLHGPVEAFWDDNDERYFGLRIEDERSAHARVIVTDEVPDEEEDGVVVLCA